MASISKVSDGKYRIRVSIQTNKDRAYHTETFRGTLKEARMRAGELERQYKNISINAGKESLGNFLTEWLESEVKANRAYSTYYGYKVNISKHLTSSPLWHRSLSSLSTVEMRRFFHSGVPGMSFLFVIIKTALNTAVAWELIESNPLKNIARPRAINPRPKVILEREEIVAFLDAVREDSHSLLFEFLLETGLRIGEALALHFTDFDASGGTVSIARTLKPKHFDARITRPKTEASVRVLALSEELLSKLQDHLKQERKRRMAAGLGFKPSGLVFCRADGQPLDQSVLIRHLSWIAQRAGIKKKITPHSLRHSLLSLLLDMGFSVTAIQQRAGHSSPATTISTYLHPMRAAEKDIAATIRAGFEGDAKLPKNRPA